MATKDITDRQVCEAYAARAKDGLPWPDDRLAAMTGQCEKVCYRAMERAEQRGLIEYGVSLRSGWLTDKGLALLATPSPPCTTLGS
jgi:hypothetical protein